MTLILKLILITFLKNVFYPRGKNSEHIDKALKSRDSKVNEILVYSPLHKVVLYFCCDIFLSSFIFVSPAGTFGMFKCFVSLRKKCGLKNIYLFKISKLISEKPI